MSRRGGAAAQVAAEQASEAARVLQSRGQQAKQEVQEEPAQEKKDSPEFLKSIPRGNQDQIRVREQIRESRGEPKEAQEPPKEAAKEPEKVEATPAPQEAAKAPEAPVEAPVEPKKIKAKVDGEEFDVPETEVEEYGGIKAYQIHKAAEKRLKEAKEVMERARQGEAQTKAMQELVANLVKSQTPQQPSQTDDQFIASKVDVIRFGTLEESASALKEVMARSQQKLDPNKIVEQATEKIRHDQAVAEFDKEFQDISQNPVLLKTALVLRNEGIQLARQKGERLNWVEFYRGIGNQIRGAIPRQNQSQAPATAEGNTSPQADKEARKASISEPPKAAAARAEAPAEPKEETREDSIRRMRKARGLPTE